MMFFIDTANINQIKKANELGILDGVTTNPSLMAKEGIKGAENIKKHYHTICELVKGGDISAEVLATTFDEMIKEGDELASIHPQIIVKVPITLDGLRAIKWFTNHNIKTNCTLVFSAGQALLAAKAGATYVSPFVGRIDDSNWDGMELIHQIANLYGVHDLPTKILAASIRNSLHIVKAAELGADVCTCPLDAITGLLKHPLTDIGLEKFIQDSKKML